MHWYAALLVYFHWSLLNWRNSVAYSFCWYMNQLSLFYFVLFCFSRPDYRDILLWYLKYGVCFFCRQVLLTCPNVFVVLKIKISWFLIPDSYHNFSFEWAAIAFHLCYMIKRSVRCDIIRVERFYTHDIKYLINWRLGSLHTTIPSPVTHAWTIAFGGHLKTCYVVYCFSCVHCSQCIVQILCT